MLLSEWAGSAVSALGNDDGITGDSRSKRKADCHDDGDFRET